MSNRRKLNNRSCLAKLCPEFARPRLRAQAARISSSAAPPRDMVTAPPSPRAGLSVERKGFAPICSFRLLTKSFVGSKRNLEPFASPPEKHVPHFSQAVVASPPGAPNSAAPASPETRRANRKSTPVLPTYPRRTPRTKGHVPLTAFSHDPFDPEFFSVLFTFFPFPLSLCFARAVSTAMPRTVYESGA